MKPTLLFHLALLLFAAALVGCGDASSPSQPPEDAHAEDTHAEGADAHDDEHGDEITLSPDQLAAADIQVEAARSESLADQLRAPARIVPTETGQAQVGALVAGRVVDLLAAEGQSVRQGAAVATIESPEVARLQGEYLQADARVTQTQQQEARSRLLAAEDLISGSLLEQAVADARAAEAQAAALAGEVRAHGGRVPTSASGVTGRVTVTTPIAGVVSERQAQLGAFVQASAPLYEVVAPGDVYADADVSPDLAALVSRGMPATVEAPGGRSYRGVVSYVGAELAGETRTATVRVRLENASDQLRPQTFVTVVLAGLPRQDGAASRQVVTVPLAAIETDGGRSFVYVPVQGEPGTYARRAVVPGEQTADRVEIASGLSPGETVVTRGVFALKSFRSRGELTEHDH
jgi:cobalt-zinc-cadmium efflux system membrane fusion protein